MLTALLLPVAACGTGGSPDDDKPSPSTSPERPAPGDHPMKLTWKGKQRTYTVHAPPSFSPDDRLPLVIAMHPYPGNADYMASISGLSEKADKEGFLVAYPDGLDGGMNALTCCGSEDDVGFVRTMTRRMLTVWKADPDRVYATGISNGADMAYKLAVELPGTFAAIAPVSGGFNGTDTQDTAYRPKSPVSVLTFIGKADPHDADFDTGLNDWRSRLSCKPVRTKKLPKAVTRQDARCADGSTTTAYHLPTMAHAWPGGEPGTMNDPHAGVDATDLIWAYFKAHPRKGT